MIRKLFSGAAAVGASMLTATAAFAEEAASAAAPAVETVVDKGDTAWMMTSTVLVLLMILPGLALFYGGLTRSKNMLSTMTQIGATAALAMVVWVLWGYSTAFGPEGNAFFSWENLFLSATSTDSTAATFSDEVISEYVFLSFQMTFAAITPALMAGAWADRARFGWVMGFCALWSLIVYAPVAHWLWGGGWLTTRLGALDFAGGIVVHTTAGVSALVVAVLLGRRQGFPRTMMLPHSPSLTMVGAALLWVGWFGFNGGSALTANDDAASAIINTHAAACAAALAWLAIERFTVGKPTSIGFATGAIAGLATVTPAAGFISPGAAILFGLIASGICYPMIQFVKHKLEIDDSLDVFAVHGVGGMVGSVMLAVFLSPALGGTGYAEGMSLTSQLGAQFGAIGVVAAWSAIASALIAVMVSTLMPMRVNEDAEREGLDITSHGERAWEFD